jgi:protein TonB
VSRPTAHEDDDKIYTQKEVTCRAVINSRPQPVYSKQARDSEVQGVVLLRVALLASGKVGEVTVIHGLPEGITEAAIEAARRIKFTPAIKDDRWVSQRVVVEYNFNIY